MACLYAPQNNLITPTGIKNLQSRIAHLSAEYGQSRTASADRAARSVGSSNGCQNCDPVTIEHDRLRGQIESLRHLLLHASRIPDVPNDCTELGIGHVGTFRFYTLGEGRKSKEHRPQLQIVGLFEEDPLAVPQRISYKAPLAQAFLEMRLGATESNVYIAGKERTVTLTAIRNPDAKGVIRTVSEPVLLRLAAA